MSHGAQITPRHPDGTLCGHQPSESACPGRADHVVTCACGWQRTGRNARRLLSQHRTHSVEALAGVQ